jgi:hypothetical protein
MTQEASTDGDTASRPFQPGAFWRVRWMWPIFCASLLLLYLLASLGTPICLTDCRGYIRLMGESWSNYFPTLMVSFRPWSIPVFFSLFGSYSIESASRIVLAQSFIGFLAWLAFAYATSRMLRAPAVRLFGFVVMALLMFGQGYYRFNQYLLSDSLALSSVLFQWSLILLFPDFVAWARRAPHGDRLIHAYLISIVLVSAFEMATRDANIMMAAAGWAFLVWRGLTGVLRDDRKLRKLLFKMSIVVFVIAIGQTISAGKRHHENAQNIMAGAVIPNEQIRRYFIQNGMPIRLQALSEKAAPQELGSIDYHEVEHMRGLVAEASADPDCHVFLERIDRLYVSFLLTHPEYVISNTWRYWRMILDFNFVHGQNAPTTQLILSGDNVPAVFGAILDLSLADHFPPQVGVALFLAGFILPWLRREGSSWLPLLLSLLGAANALLGFFGDVWEPSEMTRHAAIGSIVLRCGLTLCALMLLEEAALRAARPRGSHAQG